MNPMNKGNQFGVGGNRQAVKRVGRGNKIAPAKYLGDHSSSRIDGLNQQNDRDIENGKQNRISKKKFTLKELQFRTTFCPNYFKNFQSEIREITLKLIDEK